MRALLLCAVLVSSAAAKPTPEKFPGANLPDVTRTQDTLGGRSGVGDREKRAKLVVVTPTGITVDGTVVVTLDKGVVGPADKEASTVGTRIPKLAAALSGADSVELGIDRSLTYRVLVEALVSAKETGRSKFGLLVHAGGAVVQTPIVVPISQKTAAAIEILGNRKGAAPIGLVVSASTTEVLVWSTSGTEGTRQKPRLRVALDVAKGDVGRSDAAIAVRAELAKLVKRWKKRTPDTQEIVLLCDADTPIQLVADLLVAIRPHFSDIALSTGFE
jgi:biopolymer transport protein ExbD